MANSASGIAVEDECKLKFLELKRKKTYRYIVFKIDEKAQRVVLEKIGTPEESYDDFTASLPENDCRYAVYDFDFVTEENCQKSKIFFIAWSPDTARVKSKMIYASSKDRFRRELDGVHYELQATDPTEMDIELRKLIVKDYVNMESIFCEAVNDVTANQIGSLENPSRIEFICNFLFPAQELRSIKLSEWTLLNHFFENFAGLLTIRI
ncbi:hypothetical protein O6H91_17G008300 [Diphasiastrum complanatum]|uniref:Uncharacterized protein n=2 Tax=Diphasiastrum complanatum TaxID=34168 RepID=A0ACC2B3Y9_DIPCM|nr:hypothetical protein O6H91_17G008000 [Diphasiastrum complanatum]KAJ7524499.1 hypothetical protein O6H91_17G008300 [Diphasiastrum complanatum]